MSKQKKVMTEYRHYDLSPDFPMFVLHGDKWKISDIRADRQHFHNCLEIGICHSHEGYMEFGDDLVPFSTGCITIIRRNFPHTTYSSPGGQSLWSYVFVDIDSFFKKYSQLANVDNLDSLTNYYILNKNTSPKLYSYLMAILDEMTEKHNGYLNCVKGLMSAVFVELTRLSQNQPENSEPISDTNLLTIHPALNYIYDNYMHHFTIDSLAEMCHLSVTHFRRLFNTIMGTSPLDYINNTRINRACVILQNTDISILEISEMVGFHSISSFNRAFFKLMGTSPREWRKNHTKVDAYINKQSVLEYHGWL